MDPKQLALQFFDKAVLAGFAVWLVIAATGLVQQPAELSLKDQLDKDLKAIGEHMKGSTVPAATDPGWRKSLEGQLKADTIAAARPAPAWVLHKRPGFLYQVYVFEPTYRCKHGAPTDLTADGAQRGQVAVRWKPSLENEYVLCTYEVQRRTGETGDWETIHTAGPGSTEYVDTNIAPRATYFYKVTSVAEPDRDSPVVQRYNLTLAESEQRKESLEVGPIKTQRDVFVLPVTVTVVTERDLIDRPNAKESAYVKVYKWDADSSSFLDATFTVGINQAIGGTKKLRGGKEFDFSTGAVLDDVWYDERPHPTIAGHNEQVQTIRIRFADGSTEEFNDKDKPAELGGGN
jgi:hypothetical protein